MKNYIKNLRLTLGKGSLRRRAERRGTRFAGSHWELLERRELLTGNAPTALVDNYAFTEDSANEVSGLIHHWTFDDLTDDLASDSSGKNTLFLRGYQSSDLRSVPGKFGGALSFNRDSQYAITGQPIPVTNFSVAFWLQVDAYSGLNPRIVTPQGAEMLYLGFEHNRGLTFSGAVFDSARPALGTWEHYVVTVNQPGSTVNIYKDGAKVAAGTAPAVTTNVSWIFGHNQDVNNPLGSLDGQLDDFRVYNRVLNPTEVQAVFTGSSNVASVLANDSDAEGDSLTAVLIDPPAHGTVELRPSGNFKYLPQANFSGTDSFTYKAFDGSAFSEVTVANIVVSAVNDAPVAVSDTYTYETGSSLTVNAPDGVLKNDTDVDSSNLTANLVNGAEHGSVTLAADGSFVYVPAGGFARDSFTYQVTDGDAESAVVTVYLRTATNTAPMTASDVYTTWEDETLDVEPPLSTLAGLMHRWTFDETSGNLAADSVGNANATLFNWGAQDQKWVTGRLGGALRFGGARYAITNSSFSYNKYTIAFWSQLSVPATSNPRLIAQTNSLSILYNQGDQNGIGANWRTIVASPTKPVLGEWEHYAIQIDRITGGVAVYSNGVLKAQGNMGTLAPGGRWVLGHTDDLNNTSENWNGLLDDVRIYNRFLDEREILLLARGADAVMGSVLANDLDSEGDPLTAKLASNVQHGTLALDATGFFTYTPSQNFHGQDSFSYLASDGAADSLATTVIIHVDPVNDPPDASPDVFNATEETQLVVLAANSVLANDIDVDSSSITASLVRSPQNGSVTLNSDGTFTYTPADNFFGSDSFTYSATDGAAGSPPTTVTIHVAGTPDSPMAVADAYQSLEDTPLVVGLDRSVLQNDFEPDRDPRTVSLVKSVEHGVLTLAADGTFTYQPASNYHGADSFSYFFSDGTSDSNVVTVALTIAAVNDPPVGVADLYGLGASLVVSAADGVLKNDVDVDSTQLRATLVGRPQFGTVVLNADGSFTYSRSGDFPGEDTFSYRVSDGVANSAPTTVRIVSALQLIAPDLTVTSKPNQVVNGAFDIALQLTGKSNFAVAAYQVTLRQPAAQSGVTWVSVTPSSSSHPALFAGQVPTVRGFAGGLQVSDVLAEGSAVVTDGVGLFRVNYSVAPGARGEVPIAFVPAFTSLGDASGNVVVLGPLVSGVIHIRPEVKPGDFDGDLDVDAADVLTFMENWTGSLEPNTGGKDAQSGDLDADADVDSADLLLLLENWTGSLNASWAAAVEDIARATPNPEPVNPADSARPQWDLDRGERRGKSRRATVWVDY